MGALIVAILFIGASLFAILPIDGFPQWGPQVVEFIKGALPFLGFFIGLIALIVGFADIKDKILSKKEAKGNEEDKDKKEE